MWQSMGASNSRPGQKDLDLALAVAGGALVVGDAADQCSPSSWRPHAVEHAWSRDHAILRKRDDLDVAWSFVCSRAANPRTGEVGRGAQVHVVADGARAEPISSRMARPPFADAVGGEALLGLGVQAIASRACRCGSRAPRRTSRPGRGAGCRSMKWAAPGPRRVEMASARSMG